jgi:4-hydroxy-3-methylbut-2-enyl diphosphate reductase
VGTLGQLPTGAVTLIETAEDAKTIAPKDPNNLAFVTQTTLSIDDTAEIVALLKERFPNINGPHKEDICYATTNRQLAVKKVAPVVDARSPCWRSARPKSTGSGSRTSPASASPRAPRHRK